MLLPVLALLLLLLLMLDASKCYLYTMRNTYDTDVEAV